MLDRGQRNLLYAAVLDDLRPLGDLFRAVARGDYERARDLRRQYEDAFRLLDDIGWGPEDPGARFDLTLCASPRKRLAGRLSVVARDRARAHRPRVGGGWSAGGLTSAEQAVALGRLAAQLAVGDGTGDGSEGSR